MIFIQNVNRSHKSLNEEFDKAYIINVTSNSSLPYIKLSPFYPHGDIPVPYSQSITSYSVEGIWQGLKVFENSDIDIQKFSNKKMSALKRPNQFYGKPLGHRKGVGGKLLDYIDAREIIYIPTYKWVLENKVSDLIRDLLDKTKSKDIILLDYSTNEDVNDIRKPLSHASIIKQVLEEMNEEVKHIRFSSIIPKENKIQLKIKFG